jgi:hypothetical protein
MGPLITAEHRDRVAGYIAAGAEQGATWWSTAARRRFRPKGFFLGTTLLDHVTPEMTVYTDEIFGPVLCVVRAKTYEEGLALINTTPMRTGRRSSPVMAARPERSSSTCRSAWSASMSRSGAGGLLLFRWLEGLAVRRLPHVRRRGR